jgi:uncharacterized membrane protein
VKRSAPLHGPAPARPPPVPPVGSMPPRAVPVPVGPSPATPPATTPRRIAPPRPEPEWIANGKRALWEAWNWFLVNEKFRRTDVSVEFAVASTWLLRLGIVAIVACVGYFLMWSIDRQLIGELGRTVISLVFGIGLVAVGVRLLGRKYHLLGQGFLGGGVVTLYFSAYASGPLYHLVAMPTAFGFMVLVTTAAGVLAVRLDSMLVAVLGLVGGYVTPVLLSTGVPQHAVLFSYMLLLTAGILGVAHHCQWRLLNYLSFFATYALFAAALIGYTTAIFPLTIGFLTAFFVLHSGLVYWHNIVRGERSTVLEVIHLVANAAVYAAFAYFLIRGALGRPYPALMALGLAGYFVLHTVLFLRRKLQDRGLLTAFLGLGAVFATLTLPMALEKESLTIGFSLIGFLLLWLGLGLGSRFMQQLAYLVYALALGRLLSLDMPRHFHGSGVDELHYWRGMTERLWTYGLAIGSVFAAFFLQRRDRATEPPILPANDTRALVKPALALRIFYWGAVLTAFLFLHLEINRMFQALYEPCRLPALTTLWCLAAGYFLWELCRRDADAGPPFALALYGFALVAVVKLFVLDVTVWELNDRFVYGVPYAALAVLPRMLDFAVVLVLLGTAAWALQRRGAAARAWSFGYLGAAMLFAYLSLELNSLLSWKLPGFQNGGITILWATFAIAFTGIGIWKTVRPLRYVGLTLFVIVFGKIMFHDLHGMAVIYRVVAFFAIGVAMLLGAFAYVFAGARFRIADGKTEGKPPIE